MDSSSKPEPSPKLHNTLRENCSADIHHGAPKDWKFWCIIFSLASSVLLTAVELNAIGAALPTIIRDLKGQQFIWVGSAYALGSTAIIPLCGGLAQIIGRRPIMLSALSLFALGSIICGAASSLSMLIAGRAVQGLGAGGITSSVHIIISDLVTLRERGTYSGLMGLPWVVGGGIGPVLGGSLAQIGRWRWLFYLNIPICAFNIILFVLFLRLKTPPTTLKEKVGKMDIIGNVLVIASTTSIVIALTWGGIRYPWLSAHILSALIVGLIGLGVFIIYEVYHCKPPVIPIVFHTTWTGASAYLQNFVAAVVLSTLSYWYVVFFEACKDKSPTEAGVDMFGLSISFSLVPLVGSIIVKKTGKYVLPTFIGWVLTVVGVGLFTTLHTNSSLSKSVVFQIITGSGVGIAYVVLVFPILAAIPVTQTAPAMALYVFSRNFGYIWGITTGGAILQNELKRKLPASFLAQFPQGVEIAFATIPAIRTLDQPFKDEVRNAFADALRVVWQVLLGITIAGFLSSLGMRQLHLHTKVDEDWGREDLSVDQGERIVPVQQTSSMREVQEA